MEKDHTTLGNFTQGGKEFEYPTLNNKSYKNNKGGIIMNQKEVIIFHGMNILCL